ncbi:TIGR03667 family PPOX class F420-dependent oxidoreductase [Mycolicibacterium sp. 050158]|jgi:PPOX class probable F420-dependent enzyme|uniref:TIGR03667 family PPOX class F420-dependent oxidoreductase n=1 Tax=Mycolicibacterium sp. 050158 TaxID=3090602 RepID=UPI00299E23C5|nr:TIGR03667 family PPOX class F420-dependent oxidoreductase [Mycolicibacterium sp. 050158]MDX1888415.1 TIGR03667 family PPOX class F420-dependent oxidoreductase [Mycolicibacterium sp. 050158]
MSADLTPEVIDRLTAAQYGWLTTVAKSGQPVPKLVWFYFDGSALFIYSAPTAAKVAHVRRQPRVSVNLDSDGNGGGIIVVGGAASIDAEGVDCRQDGPYWAKYGELSDRFGLTDTMGNFGTRLRITIDKVWTTPTEG